MDYAESILDLVGDTPLIRLHRTVGPVVPLILGKLESLNPGGSVKDRIGLSMIEDAERRGLLGPGGTIIEPTSGNTGHGLAIAAAIKGYRCIFVMPDKMSQEKILLLKAYGAEVVVTPTNVERESPQSYYSVADRLTREIPGAFQPNQYFNPLNPQAHYRSTGPEIWRQTEGRITHFVCGMGTGGTISGTGAYLKEQKPSIQIVGADPEGSIYSGAVAPYKIEGVGEDFMPATMNMDIVDRVIQIGDGQAFTMARRLAREEGLLLGGSAGMALQAALTVASEGGPDDVIVVLLPDTGRNYLSKFFNDEWMRQNGFMRPLHGSRIRDLFSEHSEAVPRLVSVAPTTPVGDAIDLMQRYGISQLPVIEGDHQVVGSIQERGLLDRVYRSPDVVESAVAAVMDQPFTTVESESAVDDAVAPLLSGEPALLVTEQQQPVALLTRADLLEFMAHRVR